MTGRMAILCIALAGGPRIAAAQTVILTPADPKRWDASVTIGWLGGNKDEIAERWNNWYDTFATSVDVGRYWTPHVKTEIGATMTTEGRVYSQELREVPGRPLPIYVTREHRFELRSLNLSAAYQFFENTWVHPFLAAGVQVASERSRIAAFPTDPFAPAPAPGPPRATLDVKPFLSGGAKFYVSDRGFLRMDLSAALDARGATRVSWRAGGGVDF